jgi:hypothetical protein
MRPLLASVEEALSDIVLCSSDGRAAPWQNHEPGGSLSPTLCRTAGGQAEAGRFTISAITFQLHDRLTE